MMKRLFGLATSIQFWVLASIGLIAVAIVYYVVADRATPFTTDAYVQTFVVQVAPQVEGQVVDVNVENGSRVVAGDALFQIDPRPFTYEAERLQALLTQTEAEIRQYESQLASLKSVVTEREADVEYAKAELERYSKLTTDDFTSKARLDQVTDTFKSDTALLNQAKADVVSLEQKLASMIEGEHTEVKQVKAELAKAKLDLSESTVKASIDGVVDNMQLRAGTYADVGDAVMTLVDDAQWWVVANYQENALSVIRPGQRVMMSLFMYPGRIVTGKVVDLGYGVSTGQGEASGLLPEIDNPDEWITESQRFQVRIVFDEVPDDMPLRVGATVRTVVLTEECSVMNALGHFWLVVASYFDFIY